MWIGGWSLLTHIIYKPQFTWRQVASCKKNSNGDNDWCQGYVKKEKEAELVLARSMKRLKPSSATGQSVTSKVGYIWIYM